MSLDKIFVMGGCNTDIAITIITIDWQILNFYRTIQGGLRLSSSNKFVV